jgi:hypothetical protein
MENQRPKINHTEFKEKKLDWGALGSWDITKISEEDLRDAILYVWSHCPGNYKHDAVASFLLAETNRRLIEKAHIDSQKSGKVGLWIAVLALVLSLVSLGIAFFDYKSGNQWQLEEIELLRQQLDATKAINKR